MRLSAVLITLILGAGALVPSAAFAEPTAITVRVISKDAKFIGTSMGGMRITLRDARTGEILAIGVTHGGTGDTKRIMHKDGGRRMHLADETAAKFTAILNLDEPRLIEAEAYGPLAQPQAAHRISSSQWVVPGKNLSGGDGWVLELPGFAVDVLAPPAHVQLPADTGQVELRANVTMMCGCPITPKGSWDADRYEIEAIVRHDGNPAGRARLAYAGKPSQFAGAVPVNGPGVYDVTVYAYDPSNGNTGVDRTTFIVAPK